MSKEDATTPASRAKQLVIKNTHFNKSEDSLISPMRKIPRTYRSLRTKSRAPSGNSIHFESKLEHDIFILLKFDYAIEYIVEQPVKIEFIDYYNKIRTYTPDLLVVYEQGETAKVKPNLIEVKYRAEVKNDPEHYQMISTVSQQVCEDEDWEFLLLTDKDINRYRLQNAKNLLMFEQLDDRHDYNEKVIDVILNALDKEQESTPNDLINCLTNSQTQYAQYIPYLWHLIRWRDVGVDLNQPITMHSRIWNQK